MATLLPKAEYLLPLSLHHNTIHLLVKLHVSKRQLIFSSQEYFYLLFAYQDKIAGQHCFARV